MNFLEGGNFYNEKKTKEFHGFIREYFTNINQKMNRDIFINRFSPPLHIINFGKGDIYNFQEEVEEVRILFKRTFFDGYEIHYLDNEVIGIIKISE